MNNEQRTQQKQKALISALKQTRLPETIFGYSLKKSLEMGVETSVIIETLKDAKEDNAIALFKTIGWTPYKLLTRL